jgi:hypothetical protein
MLEFYNEQINGINVFMLYFIDENTTPYQVEKEIEKYLSEFSKLLLIKVGQSIKLYSSIAKRYFMH